VTDSRAKRGTEWVIDGTTFVFDYGRGSTSDRFLIRKPPDLVELYEDLAPRFPDAHIVELGIAAGGGTALLALLARPRRLVACELDPNRVVALDELIAARTLGSVIRPFYGVDQSDRAELAAIVDREVPDQRLDLVIDDASHLYEPTRASFEVLFPRLRPGGLYVIEDWAADYAYARRIEATLADPTSAASAALQARLAEAAAEQPGGPRPLPQIGVELLHACGGRSDVVTRLEVNRHWIAVERGSAPLDPSTFRLDDHFVDEWGWLSE
jgi:predicted O-methyltransferase YrrM